MVGAAGFEPTTSSSRTMRATKLRHAPTECPLGPGHDSSRDPVRGFGPPLRPANQVVGRRPPARTGATAKAAATNEAAMRTKTIGRPSGSPAIPMITP